MRSAEYSIALLESNVHQPCSMLSVRDPEMGKTSSPPSKDPQARDGDKMD